MSEACGQCAVNVNYDQRFEWLDGLRGVALVMMVVYHLIWNLGGWDVWEGMADWSIFWRGWQAVTGGLFLWVVGVSLWIGYRRSKTYLAVVKRGFLLVVLGTGLSWSMQLLGLGRIDFGILQCIGVSLILTYPLMRWRRVRLGLGGMALVLGIWGWNVPDLLGAQLDYYPLTPWWGVMLLGSVMGEILLRHAVVIAKFDSWFAEGLFTKLLRLLGRHSLLVYLIHQPILWAAYLIVRFMVSVS